jgi:uncharacterized protein YuzE
MAITMKIEADRLQAYFEVFTKHFLRDDSWHAADVEVLSSELGDRFVAEGAHLLGITYDPRTRALELYLESADHRVYQPKEVWVEEEEDGFVRAIEVVRPDGTKEVVRLRRLGLRPLR